MRTSRKPNPVGVNLLDAFEALAIAIVGASGIVVVLVIAPAVTESDLNYRLVAVALIAVLTLLALLRAFWVLLAWALTVLWAVWKFRQSWRGQQ